MSSTFYAGQTDYLAKLNQYAADRPLRRNFLCNGDFRIWQRGASFAGSAAARMTADRFYCNGSGLGTTAYSQQAFTLGQTGVPGEPRYYMNVNRTVASASANEFMYTIGEGLRLFAGRTLTFSAYFRVASGTKALQIVPTSVYGTGGSPSGSDTITVTSVTVTTTWTRFTSTFTVPSMSGKTLGTNDNDHLGIRLLEPSSFGTFSLDTCLWQLEYGSVATDFEWLNNDDVIRQCQRWYWRTPQGSTYGMLRQSYGAASGSDDLTFSLPTEMVRTPTVTKVGTWTVNNCTQPSVVDATRDSFTLRGSIVALGAFNYYCPNNTCYIEADCGAY